MPGYYTYVGDDLESKRLANVQDIKIIQSNIDVAIKQLIMDSLGEAYVLDDSDDAFILSPIEDSTNDVIDQQNTAGSSWKLLKDLYVKQTITLGKSSIEKVKLRLRNNYTEAITLNAEIHDLNNEILSVFNITIPNGTNDSEFSLNFGLHHLPRDDYYLILKRTNIGTSTTGLFVKYDNSGSYGGKMSEAPDGNAYEDLGYDLTFKTEYSTQASFDIVESMALIQGEKITNLDTHVTMPPASSYGDRIDIVALRRDGILEVFTGEVATKPEPADIDNNLLKVAYITVYKGKPLAVDMDVDQSEVMGRTRLRTPKHRLSDLERELNWNMTYNPPRRVKYNLTGPSMFNEALSTNIVYDIETGQYILSSNEIVRSQFTFKDDLNFTTSNIDHTNHTNGVIKLATTMYNEVTVDTGHGGSSRDVFERKFIIYKNRKYMSLYPAGYFYTGRDGYLTGINLQDMFHLGTLSGGKVYLYNGNGALIDISAWLPASNWPLPPDYAGAWFSFGGGTWLSKGWYKWVLVPDPVGSVGKLWVNPWYSHDPNYSSVNNLYAENVGWYPNPGYEKTRPGMGYGARLKQNYPGYVTSGTITSTALATNAGIATVRAELNVKLPEGTYYTLEVSNDGGVSFYQMLGDSYTFSSQTGQSFMWRITLHTNDIAKSPIIYYDEAEMYAVKFTLGLTGGTPPTTGQLVSSTFDGPRIVQYALGYAQTPNSTESIIVDKFSNWEWLRMWLKENSGQINVDIETSMDGSAWRIIKSGLTLDEIGHDATLYGEIVETDEYNYHSDLDIEVLNDQELVDPCNTTWVSKQGANVVCTADTSVKYEGTASAKMDIQAAATTGLLAYHTVDKSLIAYDQLDIAFRTSVELAEGDVQLIICSDTAGNTALATLNLPEVAAGSINTWVTMTLPLSNPSLLASVKSFALNAVTDKTAVYNIDSIKATKLGVTLLEDCEVAWTKNMGAAVTVSADSASKMQGSKSAKMTWASDPGTGLIAHKALSAPINLTEYKQLRFWIYSSVNIDAGNLKFIIGNNSACTTIVETHNVPAIAASGWTRVTIDIDNPQLYGSVKSFGLYLTNDSINSATFNIDAIEGLRTLEVPFYQKYARMRFNFSRTDGKDLSPSIRKIGVIPRLS